MRARDYCTTGKHLIQMCLNVISASLEMNNYVHVSNYVQKAESTPDVQVSLSKELGVVEGMCRCGSRGSPVQTTCTQPIKC